MRTEVRELCEYSVYFIFIFINSMLKNLNGSKNVQKFLTFIDVYEYYVWHSFRTYRARFF